MGTLLTLLALAVLQLGLVLHVRNTLLDSAAEGARFAALADSRPDDGVARARALITAAIGPAYATNVTATRGSYLGIPAAVVTVRAPLPVIGLFGPRAALEVSAHAAVEQLAR